MQKIKKKLHLSNRLSWGQKKRVASAALPGLPQSGGPTNPPSQPNSLSAIPQSITVSSNGPDPALAQAILDYNAKLTPEDIAAFQAAHATDVIARIKDFDQEHSGSSSSRRFGNRAENCLNFIQRFVETVKICINHSPEISALVLGGFKCVLDLGLQYIKFFDSLTKMIERVGDHLSYLPVYSSDIFEIYPNIKKALVKLYCVLLDFFVGVRKVFTNKRSSFEIFLSITWKPFDERFKDIMENFQHHKEIVVQEVTAQTVMRFHRTDTIGEQQRLNQKRRDVMSWLAQTTGPTINYVKVHERNFEKRLDGTGKWLITDPEFQKWMDNTASGLLWCYGAPGAGKSVLAALVIDTLQTKCKSSIDSAVAFAYCDYNVPLSSEIFVKEFIRQLLSRLPSIPPDLEAFYDKYFNNCRDPTTKELYVAFRSTVLQFKQVYIVLDALDECSLDGRKELTEFLSTAITQPNWGVVKIFITSRREKDIEQSLKGVPIIAIEAKKVAPDIEAYVNATLDLVTIKNKQLKQKIVEVLVGKAEGMFLWVEFQLKELSGQISDHQIEKCLGNLPEDMKGTYDRIMTRIGQKSKAEQHLAREVLTWLTYTFEPLNLLQIQEAVTIDEGITTLADLESSKPHQDRVIEVCSDLVVIDEHNKKSLNRPDNHEGLRPIRFVHYSVQEYLLNPLDSSWFCNSIQERQHRKLAEKCIRYLLNSRTTYLFAPEASFLKYADSCWIKHARMVENIDLEFKYLLLNFFHVGCFDFRYRNVFRAFGKEAFKPLTSALICGLPRVYECFKQDPGLQGSEDVDDTCILHEAVKVGSPWAVKVILGSLSHDPNGLDKAGNGPLLYAETEEILQLLVDYGADVNLKMGLMGHTALFVAAKKGQKEIVQLLLDKGADVRASGRHGTALQGAAGEGYKDIVELLIEKGADVDAQDERNPSALEAAADRGHKDIVRLLLEKGANVNAQDGAALRAAASGGYKGIVDLLVQQGADVHVGGGAALQAAAYNGYVGVVQLMAKIGADVNAQGGIRGTALQAAALSGYKDIVELLLEEGADVKAQSDEHGTALHAAAFSGDESIVQLLLEKGADANAQGGHYGTIFQIVVTQGASENMQQLLLDAGADVNAQGGYYGTALQAAVAHGASENTLRLLFEQGADVDAQGGYYGTALQAAAAHGGPRETIQLLIERGADVNAQGGYYGTALQAAAARRGLDDIVLLLIEKGADVHIQGGYFGTALQAAATQGNTESTTNIIELLISKGADVNVQGGHYGTILQAVAAYGASYNTVQLLLEKGADVNAQGGYYGTALQAAVARGATENTLQLLFERGADVNAQGGYYGTALQAAAAHGGPRETLQLLLGWGADINAHGGFYGTALQAAVAKGAPIDIVLFLIDNGADVNCVSQVGFYGTVLQAAAARLTGMSKDIVQLLIEKGADVNAQGGEFGTALQAAAYVDDWGSTNSHYIVRLLIEKGADVNARGGRYETALKAAVNRGHYGIVDLLTRHGAVDTDLV